jgi:uncharacterized protein
MFSKEVSDRLQFYVYRLIDPRNGQTFYVGKGVGNRVFAHAKGDLDSDDPNEKVRRIREILRDGFEVSHVIHRHGMDEQTAFEVEAALIDAYPETTNIVGGRASGDRGLMHSKQVIERYEAREAKFLHNALVINVNQTAAERDIYDAVRYAWVLDPEKAKSAEVVLAVVQGLIVGVFVADKWLPATPDNFPGFPESGPRRWGFVGRRSPESVEKLYLRHRLPESMRRRGTANPIRYVFREGEVVLTVTPS